MRHTQLRFPACSCISLGGALPHGFCEVMHSKASSVGPTECSGASVMRTYSSHCSPLLSRTNPEGRDGLNVNKVTSLAISLLRLYTSGDQNKAGHLYAWALPHESQMEWNTFRKGTARPCTDVASYTTQWGGRAERLHSTSYHTHPGDAFQHTGQRAQVTREHC